MREVGDRREGAQAGSRRDSTTEAPHPDPALTCHVLEPQELMLLTSAGAKASSRFGC